MKILNQKPFLRVGLACFVQTGAGEQGGRRTRDRGKIKHFYLLPVVLCLSRIPNLIRYSILQINEVQDLNSKPDSKAVLVLTW